MKTTVTSRRLITGVVPCATLALWAAACNQGPPLAEDVPGIESTRAAIKAALGGVENDVTQMKFDLYACPTAAQPDGNGDGLPDGAAPAQTLVSPMGPGFLPDGLARLQNEPLDSTERGSKHRYSDGLFVVDAGTCYVVRSTPLKADGNDSKDCYAASKTVAPVPAGRTREIVLLNQCKGSPKAVVDAIAALNHPPHLTKLTFEHDGKPALKFTEVCKTLRVCATVMDPDHDPMDWDVFQVDPSGKRVQPQELPRVTAPGYPKENDDGSETNCWDVKAPEPGSKSYDLKIVVQDQVWDHMSDPANPSLIPIEKFVQLYQHEKILSRAEQTFPIHVVPCEQSCDAGVDIVFTIDTSGSMADEARALCEDIEDVKKKLGDAGIPTRIALLGLTNVGGVGSDGQPLFPCLTDTVRNLLGPNVPGNALTCGPSLDHEESWGQSSAIVARRYDWKPGNVRIVVPISDEASCDGNPCSDPGSDRDSIKNAIAEAAAAGVRVSPISGTGADACVNKLAADLASGTSGAAFVSTDPNLDLAGYIEQLALKACNR